jgi:hypothetical protein
MDLFFKITESHVLTFWIKRNKYLCTKVLASDFLKFNRREFLCTKLLASLRFSQIQPAGIFEVNGYYP